MRFITKLLTYCLSLTLLLAVSLQASAIKKPNFLFIWIDDLRAELGCYGAEHIISPHIDRLADEGVIFDQAFCQEAICTVSRASLITGQRPNTNGVQRLSDNFRKKNPDAITIMNHLSNHGYETIGMGKQLHHESENEWDAWFDVERKYKVGKYYAEEAKAGILELKKEARAKGLKGLASFVYSLWDSTEIPNCDDSELHDGYMTDIALREMDRMVELDQTFFMSVGFKKPHLPFVAPKKYWDLYNRRSISVAENHFFPKDMPQHAKSNWGELKNYRDIDPDAKEISSEKMLELTHGYYACISYVDAQIGRLMKGLKKKGLANNTIVVLTSDHGFKLGEHKMWCKHTNFNIDLKVPLIVKRPGARNAGERSSGIVELIDLFPTFCDYADIASPPTVEGKSIRGLIENTQTLGKRYAFSQYPSNAQGKYAMGYSLTDGEFRYTEWVNPNKGVDSKMLYNLVLDPSENVNISSKEEYSSKMATYSKAIQSMKNAN